jgi:hypothetical protein
VALYNLLRTIFARARTLDVPVTTPSTPLIGRGDGHPPGKGTALSFRGRGESRRARLTYHGYCLPTSGRTLRLATAPAAAAVMACLTPPMRSPAANTRSLDVL